MKYRLLSCVCVETVPHHCTREIVPLALQIQSSSAMLPTVVGDVHACTRDSYDGRGDVQGWSVLGAPATCEPVKMTPMTDNVATVRFIRRSSDRQPGPRTRRR